MGCVTKMRQSVPHFDSSSSQEDRAESRIGILDGVKTGCPTGSGVIGRRMASTMTLEGEGDDSAAD